MQPSSTGRPPRPVQSRSTRVRQSMLGWAVCACLPLSGQLAPAAVPAHPATVRPDPKAAERLYLRGTRQLASAEYTGAMDDFSRAMVLDPTRQEFVQALAVAQEHRITALLQAAAQVRNSNPAQADRLLAQARGIDPENPRVVQHDLPANTPAVRLSLPATRLTPVIAGPVVLQPTAGRQSFHLHADRRTVAVQVASAFGVKAAIDGDLTPQDIRLDLDDVDYGTAIQVFNMVAGTFTTPLEPHTVLFALDTAANRTRLERLIEEIVPLPGYTSEQITDAANMVRSIFESSKVSFEAQIGALAVRAPQDTLETINATLADLLDTGSEVMIDVKLYSVSSENVRNLGVTLPSSLGAFNVRSEANSIVAANQALVNQAIANGIIPAGTNNTLIAAYLVFVAGLGTSSNLKNTFLLLGGGLTQTGLTAGSFPVLNLALRQSDARELDDVQLRIGDRTSSTVKAGTRYPIQTSLFSDVATSTTAASGVSVNGVSLSSLLSQYLGTSSLSSSAVIPQIQYEDLGLVLKAQPHVQRDGEIALHLETKLTALTGTSINGLPILASRQFSSDLTMHDGETALMSSNVSESELRAASGIPGLNELPGFQSGTDRLSDTTRGNLVVLLTPHIVRYAHRNGKGPYLPVQTRPDTE